MPKCESQKNQTQTSNKVKFLTTAGDGLHHYTLSHSHIDPFVAGWLPLRRRWWDQARLSGSEPAAPPSTFFCGARESKKEAPPHADGEHYVCMVLLLVSGSSDCSDGGKETAEASG